MCLKKGACFGKLRSINPMELLYPWMSMIPESGDGITGGGRKTITPIERMHFNLAPGPKHKPKKGGLML